jgi:hypothetical protein
VLFSLVFLARLVHIAFLLPSIPSFSLSHLLSPLLLSAVFPSLSLYGCTSESLICVIYSGTQNIKVLQTNKRMLGCLDYTAWNSLIGLNVLIGRSCTA